MKLVYGILGLAMTHLAATVDMIGYAALMRAPGLYEQEFLPMDRDIYDGRYSAFNGGGARAAT